MKHTDAPKNYKTIAIILAILLAVMSVLTIGMGIRLAQWQKETDEAFLSAYGDLLLCLMNLTLGEEDAFSDVEYHWSQATISATKAKSLIERTTFHRENRELLNLVVALELCAIRTGRGLRIDNEMYQKLKDTSAYFDDEEATLELVYLIQANTVLISEGTAD